MGDLRLEHNTGVQSLIHRWNELLFSFPHSPQPDPASFIEHEAENGNSGLSSFWRLRRLEAVLCFGNNWKSDKHVSTSFMFDGWRAQN